VSSGAASALELRGPYDVMNMCTLFGLSPSVAKDCLSTNMRQVLYHAAARRGVHKGAVSLATDFAAMTPSALLSSMSDEDDPMET
jgi:ribonuclease P/MRP protein subunit RPP1